MTQLNLEGHYKKALVIDMCLPCQAFWFDGMESLQLAPVSVLELFRTVGDTAGKVRAPLSDNVRCPRCDLPLRKTFDRVRQSTFEYRRCPAEHGRLTTFFNFLREKDFIRPLSEAQIEELRTNLKAVNCSNCGAPVELAKGAACTHCGSPLSMLDVKQAEVLVAALQAKVARTSSGTVDATLPLELERAKLDVSAAFGAFERDPGFYGAASSAGLVNAALGALSRWLANR
jgi:DNA-directed RNA polymerase subunit RPC12/RpoP